MKFQPAIVNLVKWDLDKAQGSIGSRAPDDFEEEGLKIRFKTNKLRQKFKSNYGWTE